MFKLRALLALLLSLVGLLFACESGSNTVLHSSADIFPEPFHTYYSDTASKYYSDELIYQGLTSEQSFGIYDSRVSHYQQMTNGFHGSYTLRRQLTEEELARGVVTSCVSTKDQPLYTPLVFGYSADALSFFEQVGLTKIGEYYIDEVILYENSYVYTDFVPEIIVDTSPVDSIAPEGYHQFAIDIVNVKELLGFAIDDIWISKMFRFSHEHNFDLSVECVIDGKTRNVSSVFMGLYSIRRRGGRSTAMVDAVSLVMIAYSLPDGELTDYFISLQKNKEYLIDIRQQDFDVLSMDAFLTDAMEWLNQNPKFFSDSGIFAGTWTQLP